MAIKLVSKKQDIDLYPFGFKSGEQKGHAGMKDLLGGKGANLSEMAKLGIPVPAGVTIPTTYCNKYLGLDLLQQVLLIDNIRSAVLAQLSQLEKDLGYMPLFSVRSGARVSMPGMMDTILNVGLTMENVSDWAERIGDVPALDSYRRLIQMFGSVVHGISLSKFEDLMKVKVLIAGVESEQGLSVPQLEGLIMSYLELYEKEVGEEFPDTLDAQLTQAISAVFSSWNNERAIEYRKIHNIPDDWGTAVTVQSMVFGNMGDDSATGVVFTRDPSTGHSAITGEYLVNAQGEDVVAGIRTPECLSTLIKWNEEVDNHLFEVLSTLENHYKDMQDVEFTVQQGKLYILQTRNGKRSAKAAFEIAYDMHAKGMITIEEALGRVSTDLLLKAMTPTVDPSWKVLPHLTGIPAGGGVVQGVVALDVETALDLALSRNVILVTEETDPDDIGGMNASVGILTATGGLTSHAAVVARGMNKSCVVGAKGMQWLSETQIRVANPDDCIEVIVTNGDLVTIDGSTGNVWFHKKVPIQQGTLTGKAAALLCEAHHHYGVGPVVMDVLDTPDFGLVPWNPKGNPNLVLRTALLERSSGAIRIAELLEVVSTKYVGCNVVLDLSLFEYYDLNSAFLLTLTNDFIVALEPRIAAMIEEILQVAPTTRVQLRHFQGLIGVNYPQLHLVPEVTSVSELVEAVDNGDLITIEDSVVNDVFDGIEVFAKLAGMLGVSTLARPTYWFNVLEDVCH